MSAAMIEQTAARLFADHVNRALLQECEGGHWPARLWGLVADNGLDLALAGEAAGGIGASWSDAYPILRGIGYWQAPLPLAETMVASLLLSLAGIEIPRGPITLIEESDALAASAAGAALRITGEAVRVPWARHCRWALASAGGRIALVDLHHAQSVRITERASPAGEPADDVSLTGAACVAHASNPLPDLGWPVRTLGAIATGAMMVGAMEWLLEQSAQYSMDRVQFGKPIGKNQVIQQALALMAGDVAAARMAALVACADAPATAARNCNATAFSAAAAKIKAGEAATRATAIAHQVHGAIGFTYEHALHFATRRLWSWRERYGADAWWAQRLGAAAIAARGTGFWPAMTQRHFQSGEQK